MIQFQNSGDMGNKEIYVSIDDFKRITNVGELSLDQTREFWNIQFLKTDYTSMDEEEFLPEIFGRSSNEFSFDFEIDTYLQTQVDKFKSEQWNCLSESKKRKIVGDFSNALAESLGIKNSPEVVFFEGDLDSCGAYNPITNVISINKGLLNYPDEVIDTIAHESWHAYQHQRSLILENKQDFLYKLNFENYISPIPLGSGKYLFFPDYQDQLVEAEARAFAILFREEMKR